MIPRKLSVMFAFPSYGGNGGFASEHPAVREWFAKTLIWCKNDPRISDTWHRMIADTPITMVRNRFVQIARESKVDLLVMVDSDQVPDVLMAERDPAAKPFFETAFSFIYENYDRGPHVVGAPYCGPPVSIENVYVFRWASNFTDSADDMFRLEQFSREEAAVRTGIEPVAALPTGLIMYDMRAFEHIKPPYYYYEWKDDFQAEKGSTEDVTNTRDIGLAIQEKLGYNPIHVAWDCWAGHVKPKIVSKPRLIYSDYVADKLVLARKRMRSDEKVMNVGAETPGVRAHAASAVTLATVENAERIDSDLGFRDLHHTTPSGDMEVLRNLVRRLGGNPNWDRTPNPIFIDVVEVGSFVGSSAIVMADEGAHVTCVDHWQGTASDENIHKLNAVGSDTVYKTFLHNVGHRLHTSITPLKMDSVAAAAAFKAVDRELDMVFLDAEHTYEALTGDIKAWLPSVRVGGILSGHDYSKEFPGVMQAVHECFGDRDNDFHVDGNVWWLVVTEAVKKVFEPEPACAANGYNENGPMWASDS